MRCSAAALAPLLLAPASALAEPETRPVPGACVEVAVAGAAARCIAPGSGRATWFRDCPLCPEMVVVPAGRFIMGPSEGSADPAPRSPVAIGQPFAAGRFAITFVEWDACVADLGCNARVPPDQGWGRGRLPVINVSWADAVAYTEWLSRKTGRRYRLPSEAEREYVARAGTTSPYWWGDEIGLDRANYDLPVAGRRDGASQPARIGPRPRGRTVPVDSFEPNPWGLFNVHGNVWEWTSDCDETVEAESGSEPEAAPAPDQRGAPCGTRISRGGSWHDYADLATSEARVGFAAASGNFAQGFRVVRDLP